MQIMSDSIKNQITKGVSFFSSDYQSIRQNQRCVLSPDINPSVVCAVNTI